MESEHPDYKRFIAAARAAGLSIVWFPHGARVQRGTQLTSWAVMALKDGTFRNQDNRDHPLMDIDSAMRMLELKDAP